MKHPLKLCRARQKATPQEQVLLNSFRYEVIPAARGVSKNIPRNSSVSVSCSPAHCIENGYKTCEELISYRHEVVPHFSARLVRGLTHTKEIAKWASHHNIKEVFIVGGDADLPKHYPEALPFMKDFLDFAPGVHTVGFAVYPDGHPTVPSSVLLQTALAKQTLLAAMGVSGSATTQICFDSSKTLAWIEKARGEGFRVPIKLGLPGVVDARRLVALCLRLGVTGSLNHLRIVDHSDSAHEASRMLPPGVYDPASLLGDIAPHADRLGISGIHCFTFNSAKRTVEWVEAMLEHSIN